MIKTSHGCVLYCSEQSAHRQTHSIQIVEPERISQSVLCPQKKDLHRGKCGDEVVPLRWSHSGSSVTLTVQLPLHQEVAHLFQVDVTVGANEAAGVMILVPSFHHRPPAASETQASKLLYNTSFNTLKIHRFITIMLLKILLWCKK